MRFLLVLPLFLGLACKSTNSARVSSDTQPDQSLSRLSSSEEFTGLALPNKVSYPFVKFSHFYGLPTNDPNYDAIYFQNTKRYEFHEQFLRENFERYRNIKNYEELILPPKGDESGPSIKEITAGALYYRPANGPDAQVLAYEIYFREDISPTGTVKTKIDVAEVARFDKKLKASVSFLPATSIAFVLPQKADLFAYKSKLDAAGVKFVKGWEFHKAPAGATTFVAASSYGYLRNLSVKDFDAGLYTDRDILVFSNIPLDVGPIAGVITEKPAAAHSHVMFRAQNLGVPGIYIPNALSEASIKGNLNKLVKFTTKDDGTYTVQTQAEIPGIDAEAEQYWSNRRKALPTPVADLSVKTLKAWNKDGVVKEDIKAYGAKATNFAILDQALTKSGVDRSRYSNGFMIPFSFFDKHLDSPLSAKLCDDAAKKCAKDFGSACGKAAALCSAQASGTLRSFTTAMVAADNVKLMNSNPAHRREFLTFIQRLIREAPLSTEISEPIRQAMTAYPNTVRMRLRSSTNAEDIQGLNGAGLYESKSACLGDAESAKDDDGKPSACRTPKEMERLKAQADRLRTYPDPDGVLKTVADDMIADITKKYPLSKAVRSVFASLWTERSFLTREYYGLKHLGIYMGMLCHPSFVDESANGVAVVYFENGKASQVRIEAQYDDISVTNPIFPETVPEQWTANVKDGQASDARIVSNSTLSSGSATVLTQAELSELTKQLVISATALRAARGGDRYDLEFIFDKDRTVLIKQGRPL